MAKVRLIFACLLLTVLGFEAARASEPERTLIILLDGIGYQEFLQVKEEGHFSYLAPPAKLVAPFPSLTNPSLVALTRELGSAPAPGYEDYFFSRSQNRLKGGILDRLSPGFSKSSFRQVFDYHPPGYLSALEYLLPPWSCGWMLDLDLNRGLSKFNKSTRERFLLYLGASDCQCHMGGPGSTRKFLRKLDRRLSRLVKRHPRTRLLLLSDHGNEASPYHRINLRKNLERSGYRIEGRLRSDKSVVFPRFGLIGAALLHTRSGSEKEVARIVAQTEGVHFAAVREDDGVYLFTGGGTPASIRLLGNRLRYDPGSHDPLRIGSSASRTSQQWSTALKDHLYPDGVGRVWRMSQGLVANPASVVVDLEPGYYAGSLWLDLFVFLKATHGSLSDLQSSGFLAASDMTVAEVLSVDAAGRLLTQRTP